MKDADPTPSRTIWTRLRSLFTTDHGADTIDLADWTRRNYERHQTWHWRLDRYNADLLRRTDR